MTSRTFRDGLFAAVVAVVLTVTCLSRVAAKLGVGELKTQSELEGRAYTSVVRPTVATVKSGDFQRSFESYLNDVTPLRDDILLGYAAFQRALIKASNGLFGFEVYPTYYGSSSYEVPAYGLIVPEVTRLSAASDEAAQRFVDVVNDLAAKHPHTRFAIEVITSPYDSRFNPTVAYMSEPIDEQWAHDHIEQNLAAGNIAYRFDPIQSAEEYRTGWFTTEHHWTLEQALASYNALAAMLGLAPQAYEGAELVAPRWYGARCRVGRDLDYASDFYDLPTDFSQLTWKSFKGRDLVYGDRDAYLAGELSYDEGRIFNLYDSYYGRLNMTATNHGAHNGKRCLVVGVSYTRCLKGYIAANYRETTFVDPGNSPIEKPLSAFVDEGYDDVIVQLAPYNFEGIVDTSPAFFG